MSGWFDAQLMRTLGRIAGHVAVEKVRKPRVETIEDVPRTPDDVTPEWLTKALCAGHPGAEVTGIEVLGGGSGTSTRRTMRITYSAAGREAGLPEHLYAKTMASLTQRLMLGLTDIIRVEGFVYEHVLPLVEIEIPRGYFAAFDPRSWRSIVLTEDVGATRGAKFFSPQMEVTLEQMKELLTAMASWHGKLWNHPVLEWGELQTTAERHAALSRFLDWGKRSEVGARRAGDLVPPSLLARHDEVVRAFERSMKLGSEGAMTFLHGDPHSAGNFYVTGDGRMGWADWGVCLRGGWGYDYSYAVAGSLTVEQRREWERDLLAHYLDKLAEAGGEAPDFDQAWLIYRQQLMYPYVGWSAVYGHGRFQPDSQPPEYCLPIIERSAHAIEDLDAVNAVLEQPDTERSIAR
jgi:hypothetical protein